MTIQSNMEDETKCDGNCDLHSSDSTGSRAGTSSQASLQSSGRQEFSLQGARGGAGSLTRIDHEVDNQSNDVVSENESRLSSSAATNSNHGSRDEGQRGPYRTRRALDTDDPELEEQRRRNCISAAKCRQKRKQMLDAKDADIERKKADIEKKDEAIETLKQENAVLRGRLSQLEQSLSEILASVSLRSGVPLVQPLAVPSWDLDGNDISTGQQPSTAAQLQSYLQMRTGYPSVADDQRALNTQAMVQSTPDLRPVLLHSADLHPTRYAHLGTQVSRSGILCSFPNGEAKPLYIAPQRNAAELHKYRTPPNRDLYISYHKNLLYPEQFSPNQPQLFERPVHPQQFHPGQVVRELFTAQPYDYIEQRPPQTSGNLNTWSTQQPDTGIPQVQYGPHEYQMPVVGHEHRTLDLFELNGGYCRAQDTNNYNWNVEPGVFDPNDIAAGSASQMFVQSSSDAGMRPQNLMVLNADEMYSPPSDLSPTEIGQNGVTPEATVQYTQHQYSRLNSDSEANQVHEGLLSSSLPAAHALSIPDVVIFHDGWNPGPSKLRQAGEIELLEQQFDALSVDDFEHIIAEDMLSLPGEISMPPVRKGRKGSRSKFFRWFRSRFRSGRGG